MPKKKKKKKRPAPKTASTSDTATQSEKEVLTPREEEKEVSTPREEENGVPEPKYKDYDMEAEDSPISESGSEIDSCDEDNDFNYGTVHSDGELARQYVLDALIRR